ncbi:MAG TPA: M28 family peptidase [Terriglobales bacterium]|nr:M28 family peptidase [Terriglobales bacterium]
MPLSSYKESLPALTGEEAEIRDRLSEDTKYLSSVIGERNTSTVGSLQATRSYLEERLPAIGYPCIEIPYQLDGETVSNVEVDLRGNSPMNETLIVGAHYDTVHGSPGANDNASGGAALLELARLLKNSKVEKNVRLVFFVNEEPPFFQTASMGSRVYARKLRNDHAAVSAMISLETIGFYSDRPDSQKYPPLLNLFYPSRGNFIGFVGNSESRPLAREAIRIFRESVRFPSEGIAAPADWPGIGWSDQWSFWQEEYPAIMITDTAPFRYRYYHTRSDTADKIDFERMARVVVGVERVVKTLADAH